MKDKRFSQVLSVRSTRENGGIPNHTVLVGIAPGSDYDRMHWGCGSSFGVWEPEHWSIVKEWPYKSDDDTIAISDEYDASRTPEPSFEVSPRLGFISPEGHFYPCSYGAHVDLDYLLQKKLYPDSYISYSGLDQHGWVRVMGNGMIARQRDGKFSDQMLDTLSRLVHAFKEAEGVDFNHTLSENPEGYFVENAFSSPDRDGCFVANLERYYKWETGDFKETNNVDGTITPINLSEVLTKRRDAHPGD